MLASFGIGAGLSAAMNAARAGFLALLLCWAFGARADVAVPPLSGRVIDQTGTLSSGDIASLTQTLKSLETRKGSQVAVLIVPTTSPETIEQYSLRVAEAWKIGRKKIDDGALLVVAKNDRHLRIEVGYGLEGALNDATAKRIIDEDITPKFRSGDFAGGISAGVERIVAVIDGEKLPAPESQQRQVPDFLGNIDPFNPVFLFVLFIVGSIARAALGRLMGAAVIGGTVAVVAWLITASLAASIFAGAFFFIFIMFGDSMASSSGGSGNWSSGGGSSDSGGFSGGGGSFGGGGASGSW
jgi:uncharacterized protein